MERKRNSGMIPVDEMRFKAYLKDKALNLKTAGELVNMDSTYFHSAVKNPKGINKTVLELLAIKCGDKFEDFLEKVKPLPLNESKRSAEMPEDYLNSMKAIKNYLETLDRKVSDLQAALELLSETIATHSDTEINRARRFLKSRFELANSLSIDQDETLLAGDAVGISREHMRVAREDLGLTIRTTADGKQLWCKTNNRS